MGKFLVRITTILVATYFVLSYVLAQFCGIDILDYCYTLLFELIVVIYSFSEGRYHCKFLKTTMLGIFLADLTTHLDYFFDFLSVTAHNLIPLSFVTLGVACSVYLAISHFIKVRKIKKNNGK